MSEGKFMDHNCPICGKQMLRTCDSWGYTLSCFDPDCPGERQYLQEEYVEALELAIMGKNLDTQTKPAPVQSAEDAVDEICVLSTSGYIDWREQAARLVTAQRQAGREDIDDILLQEIESLKEKIKIASEVIKSYDPAYDTSDFLHCVGAVDFAQWVEEDVERQLSERYAALVKAAMDALPVWEDLCVCAECGAKQEALRKVLSDLEKLDEARKG